MKFRYNSHFHALKSIYLHKWTIAAVMIAFSVLLASMFIQQNLIYALNGNATSVQDTGFLTYQNDKSGIRIQYPIGWHVQEIGGPPSDNITDIVSFSPPNSSNSGEVLVSIDNSNDNQSLASYLSDVIASGSENQKNYRVINANTIETLTGNPAYLLLSSYTDAGTAYETLETGTKIHGKYYFITYDIEASNYENYLPYVHKIIDSLKVS